MLNILLYFIHIYYIIISNIYKSFVEFKIFIQDVFASVANLCYRQTFNKSYSKENNKCREICLKETIVLLI